MTVNVKDDDDQDPSFIYQGCSSQGGACVNPEYYASVSTLHYQQTIIIEICTWLCLKRSNVDKVIGFIYLRNATECWYNCVEQVSSGSVEGVLSVLPEKIQAIDMDSMGAPITYSFVNGSPSSYRQYFEIDSQSGVVKQIKPVDVSETKRFDIVVKVKFCIISARVLIKKHNFIL